MGSQIHTAMICPGFTDTEMLKQHLGGDTELMQKSARKMALVVSSHRKK